MFFGSPDPAKAIAITSATNSLTSVIPNATIDLLGTNTDPVQITVSRDDSRIVDSVRDFVGDLNEIIDTINRVDSYNAETEERGLLLGDGTVAQIRSSLFRLLNSRNSDVTTQFSTLSQVGVTVGGGSRVRFDETKFRQALTADRNAVEQLFTFKETQTDSDTGETTLIAGGILPRIEDLLDNLTDPLTGSIRNRVSSLNNQIELGRDRIDRLDIQLEAKRARLEFEFLAMERALAQIQNQSSALAGLQSLAAQLTTSQQANQ